MKKSNEKAATKAAGKGDYIDVKGNFTPLAQALKEAREIIGLAARTVKEG